MQVFEVKVRKVGSSLGVLLPKEIVEVDKIKQNEKIQLAVLKKDLSLIDKAFGFAKHAKPFRRDHNDRVF